MDGCVQGPAAHHAVGVAVEAVEEAKLSFCARAGGIAKAQRDPYGSPESRHACVVDEDALAERRW